MSNSFHQGLFGCFSNCSVCIWTYFCPCIVVGRVAEGIGESYCLNCICFFVPIANLICMVQQRGKLRARQGIDGGLCTDLLVIWCLTPCGLCQMGAEVENMKSAGAGGMAVDMERY